MGRFEQAGARVTDLDAVLLSHFHVDHSNDLAALVNGSWVTQRGLDMPLHGPSGNERMPGAEDFVQAMLGASGAWHYLSGYLDGREEETLALIRKSYDGPVHFADDLQCFMVRDGGIQPGNEAGLQHPPPS